MHGVWSRVLCSLHMTARRPGTGLALALVFLRAHWMRMPMHLLAFHLGVKLWRAVYDKRMSDTPAADVNIARV